MDSTTSNTEDTMINPIGLITMTHTETATIISSIRPGMRY